VASSGKEKRRPAWARARKRASRVGRRGGLRIWDRVHVSKLAWSILVPVAVAVLSVAAIAGFHLLGRTADRIAEAGDPSLVVSARIVHEEDEGDSFVAPDGYHPTRTMLHMMGEMNGPVSQKFMNAAYASGGVNLRLLSIQLIAECDVSQGIRILNIHLVSLRRRPPLAGTLIDIPPQEGDTNLQIMFNLDEPNPIALAVHYPYPAVALPGGPYFAGHSIPLQKGKQQVFVIRATTYRFSATFDLEIDYTVGNDIGKQRKLIVRDDGHAFAVSGYHYEPGSQKVTSYQHVFAVGSLPYSLCEVTDPNQYNPDGEFTCRNFANHQLVHLP
jgi:hypothetical protein